VLFDEVGYFLQQPRMKEVEVTLKSSGILRAEQIFKDCAVAGVEVFDISEVSMKRYRF